MQCNTSIQSIFRKQFSIARSFVCFSQTEQNLDSVCPEFKEECLMSLLVIVIFTIFRFLHLHSGMNGPWAYCCFRPTVIYLKILPNLNNKYSRVIQNISRYYYSGTLQRQSLKMQENCNEVLRRHGQERSLQGA